MGKALYAGVAAVFFPLAALPMERAVRDYLVEMERENIRREFGAVLLVTLRKDCLLNPFLEKEKVDEINI